MLPRKAFESRKSNITIKNYARLNLHHIKQISRQDDRRMNQNFYHWIIILHILLHGTRITIGNFFNSRTYPEIGKTYTLSSTKYYQPDAARVCRQQFTGGTLANPKTPHETTSLNDYLRSIIITNKKSDVIFFVWIGLTGNFSKGGRGEWSDGDIFKPSIYKNWAEDEPQSVHSSCVQLWLERNNQWDDVGCYKSNYAVCENLVLNQAPVDILRIANSSESNKQNIEKVTKLFDDTLQTNEDILLTKNQTMQRIRVAVHSMIQQYDVIENGDINIDREFISVEIKKHLNNRSITLGDDLSNITNKAVGANIFLPKSAMQRTGMGATTIGVNSLIFRKPVSMFVEKRDSPDALISDAKDSSSNVTNEGTLDNMTDPIQQYFTTAYLDFGDTPIHSQPPVVVGNVISADVINVTVKDLVEPIEITNRFKKSYEVSTATDIWDVRIHYDFKCVFWNESISLWSEEGCHTAEVDQGGNSSTIRCHCNHLTSFAVLLSINEMYSPKYLSLLTQIGCILSFVGLFLTALTNLVFKQLRSKTAQQILVHVCLNMAAVNIFFLAGIDKVESNSSCFIIASVLHFFLLTTWCWMFFEALFLFAALAIPFKGDSIKRHIVLVGVLASYGMPAIVVGVIAGYLRPIQYLSLRYCWLSFNAIKYYLLIPIGVLLSINFALFVLIMYSITCQSRMFRKNANLGQISQSLRRAVSMTFVLGIPWVFAFFMLLSQHPSVKNAMEILFTICNCFQGLAVFFFFCARQENVRRLWRECLFKKNKKSIKKQPSNQNSASRLKKTVELEMKSNERSEPAYSAGERKKFRSHWTS